jgi:hypothetical protein
LYALHARDTNCSSQNNVFPGFHAHCQVQEALNITRSALRKWEVEVFVAVQVARCPMFLPRLNK